MGTKSGGDNMTDFKLPEWAAEITGKLVEIILKHSVVAGKEKP